jgi:hypothetical protein
VNLEELNGKTLALLLVRQNEAGEDEWAVLTGTARWDGTQLQVDRGSERKPFLIFDDWLGRVESVPEEVDDFFGGAKFYLALSVGNLPDSDDAEGYINTGLKWPE